MEVFVLFWPAPIFWSNSPKRNAPEAIRVFLLRIYFFFAAPLFCVWHSFGRRGGFFVAELFFLLCPFFVGEGRADGWKDGMHLEQFSDIFVRFCVAFFVV